MSAIHCFKYTNGFLGKGNSPQESSFHRRKHIPHVQSSALTWKPRYKLPLSEAYKNIAIFLSRPSDLAMRRIGANYIVTTRRRKLSTCLKAFEIVRILPSAMRL